MEGTEEKSMTFEESIQRLDAITKSLERGDRPLEEALRLFEEGTEIIRRCGKFLDEAELKVVRIQSGPAKEPQEVPFTGGQA